ncbi:MAG: hypothetical protein Q4G04_04610 [bacterium]|nr:hypothetical protein [bacterium]
MNLNERKEELKQLALASKSNGAIIFQLINENVLDVVISKINDKKTNTVVTSLVKKGYLTGNEQFIDILSEFIYYYEKWFAPLSNKKVYIALILEKKFPKFLVCKNYWGDNNFIPYYQFNMKKVIVENMYDNIKFVYNKNQKFFKGVGINNRLSLKNSKSIDVLFDFMKKLIWCNPDEFALFYVFDSYKKSINEIEKNGKTTEEITDYVQNNYYIQWSRLIENYQEKITLIEELFNSII